VRSYPCFRPTFSLLQTVAAVLLICLTAITATGTTFLRARPLMGTLVEITVEADDRRLADSIIDKAFAEMERVDEMMSSYRTDSEVSLLSRRAGEGKVKISPMLINVLKASIRYHTLSGGSFDITAGPLIRLWGFTGGRRKAPSNKEIAFARSLLGTEKLQIDPVSSTARLPIKGMEVDLGGIAKGYAGDRAVEVLKSAGAARAVVNAGGDLFVLGGGSECPEGIHVGIRHPLAKGKLLGWTTVREGAVATSGSYENYFIQGGNVFSHIIDPGTGYPVQGVLSATVLASTAMEADALATSFFVMGPEKGVELAEKLPYVEAMIVQIRGVGRELASSITTGFHFNAFSPASSDCSP